MPPPYASEEIVLKQRNLYSRRKKIYIYVIYSMGEEWDIEISHSVQDAVQSVRGRAEAELP